MLENKKIFVLGMAKSGYEAAKILVNKNNVLVTDIENKNIEQTSKLEKLGVECIFTNEQIQLLDNTYDLLVKNPGISDDNEVVIKARQLGIKVINEVELAYSYLPKNIKIIGITGSNGKTTTTTIVYNILKEADLPVYLGGNIGYPLCSLIDKVKENDILVLEISDHQLLNMENFKTDISLLTNLTEVHIDFHGTYDKYKEVKKKIFNHHTSSDLAIINKDNDDSMKLTHDIKSSKKYFSTQNQCECYINNDYIYYKNDPIISLKDIKIKGMHNYENIMAAIIIVKEFEIDNNIIKKILENFNGVEHRIEYVAKKNERYFYNDSKATNNKSTSIALKSFETPTILIMGGTDRGIPFDELINDMKHVTNIICYGETKDKIKDFGNKNKIDTIITPNLEEATKAAYNVSNEGDTILLSPACASWDQFNNFEERGNLFKETVERL